MLTSEINLKSDLNFPIIPLPLHPDFWGLKKLTDEPPTGV